MKNKRGAFNKEVTWSKMIMRYGQYCAYCLQEPAQSIDHVIPWSYSYDDSIDNLRPCCMWCNLHASDKMFNSFLHKQDFLRARRGSGRTLLARTICTTCFLPYQRPHMTTSLFECPFCDPDKSTGHRRDEWNRFLSIMKRAGIRPEIHEEIRKMIERDGMTMKTARIELGDRYIQAILGNNEDDSTLLEMSYFGAVSK